MLDYEVFSSNDDVMSVNDCEPDPCGPDYDTDCMPDCDPSENGFDCCPFED